MYIIYILAQKIINNICNIYNILFGFFFSGLDRVRIKFRFRVEFRYKKSGSVKSIRVETVRYLLGSDFSAIPTILW